MNKIKEAVRFCHLGSQKIKMSPRLFQLTTSKRLFRTKAAKELSQVALNLSNAPRHRNLFSESNLIRTGKALIILSESFKTGNSSKTNWLKCLLAVSLKLNSWNGCLSQWIRLISDWSLLTLKDYLPILYKFCWANAIRQNIYGTRRYIKSNKWRQKVKKILKQSMGSQLWQRLKIVHSLITKRWLKWTQLK